MLQYLILLHIRYRPLHIKRADIAVLTDILETILLIEGNGNIS